MNNLETDKYTKEDYNNIPVYYCKHCGSLRIMIGPQGILEDFCDECGSTNIGVTDIVTWQELYNKK